MEEKMSAPYRRANPEDGASHPQDEKLPEERGLRVCGYCGTTLRIDGEILHRPDCIAREEDPDGTELF